MTEEQYKKYQALTQEIKPVKEFLSWCGEKYHHKMGVGRYLFSIIASKERFALRADLPFGSIEQHTYPIPKELQKHIIEVIEQYVDEKEKELEDI